MFFKTYKTTFKRILRSPLFWMALLIVGVLVFIDAYRGSYGGGDYSVFGYDPHLGDRDPRFILGYNKYHEVIIHRLRSMMFYAIPCLCAITVMTVVTGDYSDNFYEIERSGGVRSSAYFFGRFAAIVTLLFSIVVVFSLFSVNYYFFTRGGLANLTSDPYPAAHVADYPFTTLGGYLFDSTKVVMRLILLCMMPPILLFTTFSYAVGTYFESGLLAGIGGSGAAVVAYLAMQKYAWVYDSVINKYFLPTKNGVYSYLSRYDTLFNSPEFENEAFIGIHGLNANGYLSDTLEGVIGWLITMLTLSLVFMSISYICTRRRKM